MNKPKPVLRDKLASAVLILSLGAIFLLNIVIPPPSVLISERRIPAKLPELSLNTVLTGGFMSNFEDYAADNFVFRDAFRSIHSILIFDIFFQRDMTGLYRSKNIGLGEFHPIDESAYKLSAHKIDTVAQILSASGLNVYYSLIPDKSLFAEHYLPGFDLVLAEEILDQVLGDFPYISLADLIDAGTYYKTDLHWDQTKIADISDYIVSSMGAHSGTGFYNYEIAGEFYGLYAGQYAFPVPADTLSFVSDLGIISESDTRATLHLSSINAKYLSEKTLEFELGLIYDIDRYKGIDPYDFFLSGPQPLIILENTSAPERELFMFRDSFGSSLAPLFMPFYSRIYLIDLRYINFKLLDLFIDFTPGADALFIYSSQIFNNPSILQVS